MNSPGEVVLLTRSKPRKLLDLLCEYMLPNACWSNSQNASRSTALWLLQATISMVNSCLP